MRTLNDNEMELSEEMLENVSGGTFDLRSPDMILTRIVVDYLVKNPDGTLEDLMGRISKDHFYSIDDVQTFRFDYEADSPEMNDIRNFYKTRYFF